VKYFKLDEEHQLKLCANVLEWALFLAAASEHGSTQVGDVVLELKGDRVWVATNFIGAGFALFETLVVVTAQDKSLGRSSVIKRYDTWEAAIAGHVGQVSFFEALGYTPLEVTDAAGKD